MGLNFSEVLVELKKGEAVRYHYWPPGEYLAISTDASAPEYDFTQTEVLGAQWEMA